MRFFKILATAVFVIFGLEASADEGMWMIQDINEALEKNMQARGLRLAAGEIYNADAPGASLSDAVVSLGFYCTGSVISPNGLIITNHHCAYANIAKLSTPENNYLENGFWAMNSSDEIPISGESVYFLKKVIDVTDEYAKLSDEMDARHERAGSRKLSSILEKKYAEETGLEAILSSMWAGEKHYMSLYKVYTDLRLVAAPPLCIGYFGGDEDNWEWPRQNCDFALYRIYENGVPVNCQKSLKISLKGYYPGSFAMVIGYPGSTDRYCSSAKINYLEEYELPISTKMQGAQIKTIRKWMDADPEIRMKYSDWFFGLCNVQENNTGMLDCFNRFRVYYDKKAQDEQIDEWINESDNRKSMWGSLVKDLNTAYSESNLGEKEKAIYRETLFRGTFVSRYCFRAVNSHSLEDARKNLQDGISATDSRVEKELLANALKEYFELLDPSFYGPYLKSLHRRFGDDWTAMADYLWDNSLMASADRIGKLKSQEELKRDPLVKLFTDVSIMDFNNRDGQLKKWLKTNSLEREYERALYWTRLHKDIPQYPDANSTMRISYGTVGGYSPMDGTVYDWHTTTDGILEKYDPNNHDFNLNARQLSLLKEGKWGKWGVKEDGKKTMYVDFLTDNDITGGNSGSPVLDADGNLIGLAFDGNKESLASDVDYTYGYNKCINTDIRYVLWVLDRYAGMKRILNELEFVK
jgi:hypothetical protein